MLRQTNKKVIADWIKRALAARPQKLFALLLLAACSPEATSPTNADMSLPMPTAAGLRKVALLAPPYNSADITEGRVLFTECAACHRVGRDQQPDTKGPNLYGFFNRRAASVNNFSYSEALREANIVWDEKQLDQWLFNPREKLPGTTMGSPGIRNDTRRRNLMGYLIAITDSTEQ